MKSPVKIKELVLLALCVIMALFAKKLVSPFTNMVTDFMRIPGGGAATAFSLMFIIIGAWFTGWRAAGSCMGFVQAVLALALGMSSYQGALALLTYTVPGLAIDIFRAVVKKKDAFTFMMCNTVSNTVCAFISNCLVFHLKGFLMILWLFVAAAFGIAAGSLGHIVYRRLADAIKF